MLRHSPLDARHRALGAKLVPFGGWDMPLQYEAGTLAEHRACRTDAVVFDVSHLGTVRVRGDGAFAMLQETLTNDLLDFARTGNLALAETDPTALLREVAGHVDGERIRIDSERAPDKWPLDAPRMRQVLTNLLENAVQAGDGPVVATVAREGGELAFEVRDHGPGVKE